MRYMTRHLPMVLALLMLLAGCQRDPGGDSGTQPGGDERTYTIVTTTGMITDLARRVGGERAEVIGLISSGVDPHLYQPTRDDMVTLTGADVVLYNGLHLEGKMTEALKRIGQSKTVVAVTEAIDASSLRSPEAFEGNPDPHVWMDPTMWASALDVIERTLAKHDPDHAQAYAQNAAALRDEIEALDAYARQALGSIPEGRRVLVTAHDAFNYFGERYGIEVVGIQGISTESEAGVRDIERIVELLVTRKIGAVFVETTVSDRNIRALIAGAASRGHTVVIGGSLYSDAMGMPDTYEGTYVGMIDHNVTTIARALGGQAPEKGLTGRLSP